MKTINVELQYDDQEMNNTQTKVFDQLKNQLEGTGFKVVTIMVIFIPIIILAILEETIQFAVNRKVFGKSGKPVLIKQKLHHLKNKFKYKKSHSQ